MAITAAFFGLTREPFKPAPDPAFLCLTPGHDEALATLHYGVTERKGFMLLSGDAGTGKTTLLRALTLQLGDHTAVAFVTHSALPFEGIMECVLDGFGIAKAGQSLAQQLLALQGFLTDRHHAGQNAVVVLDEAQDLAPETLERIRLLSNIEAAGDKLLQIVLAGQPELVDQLARPGLRQLEQRIALRCRIAPLTRAETSEYIQTRLRIAGAPADGLFTDEAIDRIARATRGIPRLINNLCDHCLVIAYADQVRRVEPRIVEEARRDAAMARRRRFGRFLRPRALAWASGVGAAAVAALAALHAGSWRLLDAQSSPLMDFARSMRDLVAR